MRTAAEIRAYQASSFGSPAQVPTGYRAGDDATALSKLDEVVGDTQFNYGAWSSAREMERLGGQVYRYRFVHPIPGTTIAPTHDDELPYVFGTLASGDLWRGPLPPKDIVATDRHLSQLMGDAWTAFARAGVPEARGLPNWPRGCGQAMVFSAEPTLEAADPSAALQSLQTYFGHGDETPLVKEPKEA